MIDPDRQAVIDQTDRWLQARGADAVQLDDILSNDFRYSSSGDFGVETMTKAEIIKLSSMITGATSKKLEHQTIRLGEIIISITMTLSQDEIAGDLGGIGSAEAANATMLGKRLVYASGWRQEDHTWRCFDIHLIAAL